MSEPWIKMRISLGSCPKVVRIMSALKADRLRTVGGLHAVWCLFDTHSEDGFMEGYSLAILSEAIGWPGFAEAMKAVGWLEETDAGLIMPRFSDHNGESAKRRAMDAARKAAVRELSAKCPHDKRTKSGQIADQIREEKEEKSPLLTPPSGDAKNEPFDIDPTKPRLSAIWHRFLAHCATLKRKPTRESTELWIERLRAIPEDLAIKTVESWIASGRYTPPADWLETACKTATGPPPRPVGAVKAPWQENGHWLCQDAVVRLWWDGKKWVPIKGKSATTIQEFLDSAKAPAAVSVFEEG